MFFPSNKRFALALSINLPFSEKYDPSFEKQTAPESFLNWTLNTFFSYTISSSEYLDINSVFYNEFFTLLILADAFILLISFKYTERYSQLIRNTGFIISTILIRLSFGTTGITNVSLIISSVLFGLLILRIYNEYEKI